MRDDLFGFKEEGDLFFRILETVRSMDDVVLDVLAEIGADRSGRRLAGIGGAHTCLLIATASSPSRT